ncbi:MAG: glycosyltransferase N-terminal domain-containing protein [Gemmatimonadota bacterium]
MRELLYEAALGAARPVLRLAAPFHPRLSAGVAGRAAAVPQLATWGAAHRRPSAPLVWVHAPSVGEALMAQAILEALLARRPGVQIAFTWFSTSAERVAARVPADVRAYLPWDTRGPVRRALDALRPDALVFVRTEIWPVLVREAAARGIPCALLNAVLSSGSTRASGVGRWALEPAYARLTAIGAVSDEDAARFPALGVPAGRVRVTGDARFDQVWGRVHGGADAGAPAAPAAARGAAHEPPAVAAVRRGPGVLLVAGSTWPADEALLVPALAAVRRAYGVRAVIAPHEPTPAHLDGLERTLVAAGLEHARLAAVEAGTPAPDVVVVDRVGVLADLYKAGSLAWVGGGFGVDGLHSVVEPAALGLPVLFGPRFGNAREAEALAAEGGGFVARTAAEAEAALRRLLADRAAREDAGRAALDFVRARLGGAAANAALVEELLDGRGGA